MLLSIVDDYMVLFDPFDETLTGATTPGQSGPESHSNEEVLDIPQAPGL